MILCFFMFFPEKTINLRRLVLMSGLGMMLARRLGLKLGKATKLQLKLVVSRLRARRSRKLTLTSWNGSSGTSIRGFHQDAALNGLRTLRRRPRFSQSLASCSQLRAALGQIFTVTAWTNSLLSGGRSSDATL